MGQELTYYWKIKALEAIEMSTNSNLPNEEKTQLINALIDNHRIKDILMKPTDVPCDDAKPKIQISTPIITQTQTPKYAESKRRGQSYVRNIR